MFADAFVEGFVAPADQRQLVIGGKLARHFLVEALALRAEQDHRAGGGSAKHALHRGEDRLGLHHHAPAAAVGGVVSGVVFVGGPIADVVGVNLDQIVLDRAFEDADIKIGLKDFREETEDVKSHR